MDPITMVAVAKGLTRVVPSLIGLFKGNDAGEKAQELIGIAKQVTGLDDDQAAVDAVAADPAAALQFKEKALDYMVQMRQADNVQLETVNSTMRAELASKDKFNSRWRATFGYCVGFSWTFLFLGVVVAVLRVIFKSPTDAGEVIKSIGGMLSATTVLWGIALAILGVSVHKRSKDKETAAGISPGGLVGGLMQRLTKG